MPDRLINESIRTSEKINSLTWFQEVLFTRLLTAVDDFGRFDARPAILKASLFPLKKDVTEQTIVDSLDKLAIIGLVNLYEVGGKPYLCLPTWADHQRVRNKRSKYPEPVICQRSAANCGELPQNAARIQSNPIRIQSESNPNPIQGAGAPAELADFVVENIDEIPFNTFWEMYPRKEGKEYAMKAFSAAMIADIDPETIIAGLRRVIELQWSKLPEEEKCYIPKPEKWIRGKCWEDEVRPYRKKRVKKTEELPEYWNADPVRKKEVIPATPEEIARVKALLKKTESRNRKS